MNIVEYKQLAAPFADSGDMQQQLHAGAGEKQKHQRQSNVAYTTMCTLGEWQLKAVAVQYSQSSMKSLGTRFFLQHLLPRWVKRNPQVKLSITHQEYMPPQGSFHFVDGSSKTITFSKLKAYQIELLFNHYRNSANGNEFLSHSGPQLWTERRSIQGLWRPTLEGQMKALSFCVRKKEPPFFPHYSVESLHLCRQAIQNMGRWGDSRIYPKGWDTLRLQDALCNPFIPVPSAQTSITPTVHILHGKPNILPK